MSNEVAIPDWMRIEDSSWDDDSTEAIPGYQFYNNEITLHFDPGPHIYYQFDADGNRVNVDGVTTVLDVINKPFLKSWAAKLAVEFVKDSMILPSGQFKAFSTEEFMAMLHEAKGQHKVRLDIAGDIGHIAHDILEHSIRFAIENTDGIILELKRLPTEETDANRMAINCANAAWDWAKKHNVKWLATERKVYSREYNFAGTMDGECLVDSCTDLTCCKGRVFFSRRAIADFKSSNQLSESYALQVAAYRLAQIEEFGTYIPDGWTLRLGKESGDFESWYIPADEFEGDINAFLSALTLHRSLKEITERRRVNKAAIRQILKEQRDAAKAIEEAKDRAERAVAKSARMAATKVRNEAKDALYKSLRAEGMNPTDAKAEIAIRFPTKPKADKDSDDEPEAQVESKPITIQEKPFEIEWVLHL